ncbi:MAG: hypothetical protein GF418_12250 [Chitinivibrionales bacterium]|nr:hypothetical protein [Chitinivibrionales bacterium]MBD3396390.1 hypothetical protein [Chitinivibrionales bacterium]
MKRVNSLGIVSFKRTAETVDVLTRIHVWAQAHKIPILFHPSLKGLLPPKARIARSQRSLITNSQALVSVGGDGTFLAVAHLSSFSEKPVVGINLGSLGFLTDIGPEDVESALLKIHRGNYRIISRMVLQARLRRRRKTIRTFSAINDIFINRAGSPKLTSISAWHGKRFITDFQADGIVVATPSGSTAYSLSAGGPIVDPAVSAFLLTPICPHSLTERPLILPSDKPVRLVVNQKNPSVMISADGIDSARLRQGDEVVVSHAGAKTNLIQLGERSYFELLRKKLHWGQDYKLRRERT